MHRTQRSVTPLVVGLVIAACIALSLAGCGTPAAPLPPSLNLPAPVLNLVALRVGNSVHLTWTMPTRTTDKVLLRNTVAVQLCRSVQEGLCTAIANLSFAPGAAAAHTDDLPPDLIQGPDRLLRYEVAVRNRVGKSAGPSNAAYSAAGVSPSALGGLTAQVRGDGVLLAWQPVPDLVRPVTFRIERLQTSTATAEERPKSPLASPAPAAAQTLVVHVPAGTDPGHAIDTSAQFNQQYRYILERVANPELMGHSIDLQGPPSEAALVTTTDKFPPAVPAGLVAVADVAGAAIDLSWSPDTDSDLAAYHVYRRDAQGGSQAQSVASLHLDTSFRDTSVQPGHTYAYSISASDQSGNESHRSTEVEETFPAR